MSNKPLTPIVLVGQNSNSNEASNAPQRKGLVLAGVIGIGLLVMAFAWPGDFLTKLVLLNSGVCPQRPDHTFFFGNQQMPLEARMVGIFGGFLLTLFGLWLVGRGRALQWPRLPLSLVLGAMVLVMVLDGLNATAYDLGWPTPYAPQNWLRLITGTLSGVGLAGLLLPIISMTIWSKAYLTPTFKHGWEIAVASIPAGLMALGVLSGWPLLFWPLSLIAAGGVIAMLVLFNLLIAVIVLRRENRAEAGLGLLFPLGLVLLVSLGQMGLFAFLRVTFAGPSFAF